MNYLILIIVGIAGVWVGYKLAAASKKGIAAHNAEKREKKEQAERKIVEFLSQHERIGNNDVEKLLGVSDATATNYLQELEDESKIKQIGKEGRSVYYTLK